MIETLKIMIEILEFYLNQPEFVFVFWLFVFTIMATLIGKNIHFYTKFFFIAVSLFLCIGLSFKERMEFYTPINSKPPKEEQFFYQAHKIVNQKIFLWITIKDKERMYVFPYVKDEKEDLNALRRKILNKELTSGPYEFIKKKEKNTKSNQNEHSFRSLRKAERTYNTIKKKKHYD